MSAAANGSTQLHPTGPFIFICFILYLQGNIRVFCRVRPLVDGGVSKHIQLPASDNKSITLAKTEEVSNLSASRPSTWKDNGCSSCFYRHGTCSLK